MAHAEDLVAVVRRSRLHQDPPRLQQPCADDPGPLDGRCDGGSRRPDAARWPRTRPRECGLTMTFATSSAPRCPVPGGADHEIAELRPDDAESGPRDPAAPREAFDAAGRRRRLAAGHGAGGAAGGRVRPPPGRRLPLRARPGSCAGARRRARHGLRGSLDRLPDVGHCPRSSSDGWAVLKVGPGLTFALREALFALAAIEDELIRPRRALAAPEVVEERMLAHPEQWQGYYSGHRAGAGARPAVQLQRPDALLLAGP